MSVTGGFEGVRRAECPGSPESGSSTQMSAVSSATSTNSKLRIFFTTLGVSDATGLYGPGDRIVGVAVRDSGWLPSATWGDVAAAARRSSPGVGVCVVENTDRAGSCAGSGMIPKCPLAPACGE